MYKSPVRPRHILSTIILAATVSTASAQTNGTWTNLSGGSWATGLNWAGGNIADGVGAVADLSTLNITAATTVTLDGPRTLGTIRFADATTASHDWTLAAGTGGALTLATASGPAIIQVNNRAATISAPISGSTGISVTGAGNLILSGNNTFTGQVTVAPNATLTATNNTALGATGVGNETIIQSGGVLNLAVPHNTSIGTDLIRIAGTGINNAGAIVNTTSNWAIVPNITLTAASSVGGTGRWHIGGGTLDLNGFKLTKVGSNQLVMNGGTVSDGDIDVNAGTLSFEGEVNVKGTGTVTVKSGATLGVWGNSAGSQTRHVALEGGSILRELGSPGTSTLSTPITLRGNVSVVVSQNGNGQSHLSLPAGISEDGGAYGFTRTGDGKLTLGGANTFTGTVNLNAGPTVLAAGSTLSAGTINLASGATLDFAPAGGHTLGTGQTLSAGRTGTAATDISGDMTFGPGSVLTVGVDTGFRTLTLANSLTLDSATVNFDVGGVTTAGSGANDLIAAGQNLTLSGTNTFAIRTHGSSPVAGTYTLATYAGTLTGGAGNISIAPPASTRQTFTPDTTTTPGSILLQVTGAAGNLTWVGSQGGNAWDLNNTSNFTNGSTGEKFFNLDTVNFTDSGASTVELSGTLEPALVAVNNPTKNYTFGGAGKLTGNTVVTKSGAGTLEISGATHDFKGGLTINGGTVSVPTINAAGVAGPLGVGPVTLAGGTLAYSGNEATVSTSRLLALGAGGGSLSILNQTTTLTLTASPTGSTGFTKTGPGTLLANYSATYSGGTTIKEGILKLGNATALGNSGTPVVTVLNGAALDANGVASPASGAIKVALTIEGDGPDNLGALRNYGAGVSNNSIASSVTLTGNTSIGTNSRYDFVTGIAVNGGEFTLTKKGTGETWWAPNAGATIGSIIVEAGRFGVQSTDNLGSLAHSITVKPGAMLSSYAANSNAKPIILQGGMLHNNSGGTVVGTAGTWNGTLTLEGSGISNRIDSFGGPIVLNGKVTGAGGFEQLSSGGTKYRVDLSNADNDWEGETQITAGTLRIVGSGKFSPDSLLTMNGGQAIFDGANTAQTVNGLRGNAGTITNVDLTVNDSTDEFFAGQITGAGSALTKSGSGNLTLLSDNTYGGATRITSGILSVSGAISNTTSISVEDAGVLRLSGESNTGVGRINNSAAIRLGDAIPTGVPKLELDPSSMSQISEQMGALTLSSDAIIDFGENFSGGILRFADSSALSGTWNGTLEIWNWTGNMTGTGIDQLFFGTTLGGLTANQLDRITFYSDEGQSSLGTATFLPGGAGQVVPVPEPAAALHLVAAAIGLGAWRRRRS